MSPSSPKLTIIGDVGVDVILGPINNWPEIGTETITDKHELRPGGSACNTALALNYVGGEYTLLSLVGNNHFGKWLASHFANTNSYFSECNQPTTMSVCLTHSCSERTIFTTKGHLEHMEYEHAVARLAPAQSDKDIVLLTGVFLTPKLRTTYIQLLKHIHDLGYQVALDTGWPTGGWNAEVRREVLEWLPYINHLLVNKIEAFNLADTQDISAAMDMIHECMPEGATLVVKLGSQGSMGRENGNTVTAKAQPVEVQDSIGAGDSFNAGYLYARILGLDLYTSLETGCNLASTVISRSPRGDIRDGELAVLAETKITA